MRKRGIGIINAKLNNIHLYTRIEFPFDKSHKKACTKLKISTLFIQVQTTWLIVRFSVPMYMLVSVGLFNPFHLQFLSSVHLYCMLNYRIFVR